LILCIGSAATRIHMMAINIWILSLLQFYIISVHSQHESVLYTDVNLANCTESLIKIKNVPIKVYELKYDSVQGRTHMGVLGYDAERFFPDSVDVIPHHTVPNRDRKGDSISIKNFPIVDKNVLFMHSFAAVQELALSYEALEQLAADLRNSGSDQRLVFEEIERRLAKEADQQVIEEQRLALVQKELIEREALLEEEQAELERERMAAEVEEERAVFKYQVELLNLRISREEEFQRRRLQESVEFERELVVQRELLRRETEEKLQQQRIEFDRDLEEERARFQEEKIRAEMQAKADLERKNEDITIRKLHLQSALDAQRFMDNAKVLYTQAGLLVTDLVTHPRELFLLLGLVAAAVMLYYAAREAAVSCRQLIQSRFGRPMLVRETSYSWSLLRALGLWSGTGKSVSQEKDEVAMCFSDVVLCQEDMERVVQLTLATRNTKRLGASYRHVLLYGPPGTGKTLIARKLAESSGMDYAVMSGGDIGPLGEDAVNQLHALFRWASRSQRGLLLFIDESEAFLGARERQASSDNAHIRHALNALLYQTGTHSNQFMLVLATNRPEELDSAILDRLDVSMIIGLPALPQRFDLIKLYMRTVVEESVTTTGSSFLKRLWNGVGSTKTYTVDKECLSDDFTKSVAKRTEGFSGREIAKLAIALQYAMMLSPEQHLSKDLFNSILDAKINEHAQKVSCHS